MKRPLDLILLAINSLVTLILILPALYLAWGLGIWGPTRYVQPQLQLVNGLWWPIFGAACLYPIIALWATWSVWWHYRARQYRRVVYSSFAPWLTVGVAFGALWLMSGLLDVCYHRRDCLPHYYPPPTPTFSAQKVAAYHGKLVYNSADGLTMLDFNTGPHLLLPNDVSIFGISLDGRQVVVLDQGWKLLDLDSRQMQVLPVPDNAIWFTWSPDGKRLLYVNEDDNHDTVYILDLVSQTTQHRTLPPDQRATGELTINSRPSWSPDGAQITFSMRGTGGERVFKLDLSCTDIDQCRAVQLSPGPNDTTPAWSPDGATIVFSRWSNSPARYALYAVDPDGTHERKLTQFGPRDAFLDYNATWSPDGKFIAFTRYGQDTPTDPNVFVVGLDGTAPVQLTYNRGSITAWIARES